MSESASRKEPENTLDKVAASLPPSTQKASAAVVSKAEPSTSSPTDKTKKDETPVIDRDVFDQILEMDEDDPEREFSRDIVKHFLVQAQETFQSLEVALKAQDMEEMHQKGHYLKGSSAALGINKMRISCESIQNLGKLKNEAGSETISEKDALQKLAIVIPRVKEEYKEAETWLHVFYDNKLDLSSPE